MFRYVVLGLLRRDEAHHGYALMKLYRERSGLQVSTGNFYRELQRLMSDGLIETATGASRRDPRQAPYQITELGKAAFDAWLAEVASRSAPSHDDEMACRALFIGDANPDIVHRVLNAWQNELWLEGKLLERDRQTALSRGQRDGATPLDPLPLLLTRRLKHVAADLDFVEEFRTVYEAFASSREAPARTVPAPRRVTTAPAANRRRAERVAGTRTRGGKAS